MGKSDVGIKDDKRSGRKVKKENFIYIEKDDACAKLKSKKKGKGGSKKAPSNLTNSTTTKQQVPTLNAVQSWAMEEGLRCSHAKCCSEAHMEALARKEALERGDIVQIGLRQRSFVLGVPISDIVGQPSSARGAKLESMRKMEEILLEDRAIRRKKLELLSQSAEEAPYMYCVERESPKPLYY